MCVKYLDSAPEHDTKVSVSVFNKYMYLYIGTVNTNS